MWNLKYDTNELIYKTETHRHRKQTYRVSLALQWLGLRAFTAEGMGSIPGRGTKVPHTSWRDQKKKKENKFTVTKGERGRGGIN